MWEQKRGCERDYQGDIQLLPQMSLTGDWSFGHQIVCSLDNYSDGVGGNKKRDDPAHKCLPVQVQAWIWLSVWLS